MAFQVKNSRFAVVRETTEGVPVSPTAGTNYIAIQDGYSMQPSFAILENKELTGSIGRSKATLGIENPKASVDHYLRHSGVEGQEPDFGLLLEMSFGAKSVASTEATVVSATAGTSGAAATITVQSGQGALFERGQAVLGKDGVNGYFIRNVISISGDVLTLAQNLPGAPATGVKLGKAILYKPGNNHPTASVWDYKANSGAIEMMSGSRVTSMSADIAAGEFINSKFALEGIAFYFNPIEIKTADQYLDFTDDIGTAAAIVPVKIYKDPQELADALQAAMQAVTTTTPTVTYSSTTGKFTIKTTGTLLSLLFLTGTNNANSIDNAIGFTHTDHTGTGATTGYASDTAQILSSPQTPSFDSSNPLVAKDGQIFLGDFSSQVHVITEKATFKLDDKKTDIKDVGALSGKVGSVIIERDVQIDIEGVIPQYDVDKWNRFRQGIETSFMYNTGVKAGGNWQAGKNMNIFMPTCTITSFELGDSGGLVTLKLTVQAFVKSGAGEAFLNVI